jgi:hypothetical protein
MFKISKKPAAKAVATLLFVPIAGFTTLACAEQYVPLFDRALVKASNFPYTNINQRYSYASKTITAYCDVPSVAYIKTDNGDGTYGAPIVDNYITAGDDLKSVCVGGVNLPSPVGGTNCFKTGTTTPINLPIQDWFDATGVTAPIALAKGENTRTFQLWDYGGVRGNTKLVLEIPQSCSTINEWCSPGYWKNHPLAWAPLALLPVPITQQTAYDGPTKFDPKKRACYGASFTPTLMEVISTPQCYGGEAANAVADILSAAHPDVDFYGTRVEGSCPLN